MGSGPQVKCHSHIKGIYYQYYLSLLMLALVTWLRQCWSGFSVVKLLLLLPFCTVLFARHRAQSTLKEWCIPPLWGWSSYKIYLEFCTGYLISPPFINVFNLFISAWTQYFILYNLILFYMFSLLKLFQLWPLGALSVGFYIYLTYPHCACACVRACAF